MALFPLLIQVSNISLLFLTIPLGTLTTNAKMVASALLDFCTKLELPQDVELDKDSKFCSNLFQQVLCELGVKHVRGLLEKYPTFGWGKKLAYLERWKANHPQGSLLGIPYTSPSGAATVGSISKKPLSKWSLARLSLQP